MRYFPIYFITCSNTPTSNTFFFIQAINEIKANFNVTINPYKMARKTYNDTIQSITKAIAAKFERGICKEKQTKKSPDLFKQYQSYYLHNAPKNLCQWCFEPLLIDIARYIDGIEFNYLDAARFRDLLKKMVCPSVAPL